jgi:uncharacterized protein
MKRVFSAFLLLAMALSMPSLAQAPVPAAPEPAMGSEASAGASGTATEPATVEPGAGFGGADGIFRVLIIGDSLAGGFGAGLARMAEDDQRIEVVNRFNEASGLARPEFYDWVAAVPKIVIAKDYDAAVVHLGINDRQAMRSDGGQSAFRSPEWTAAYKAQAEALADRLQGAGLHVYWLAIPPVADPALDADLKFISALHKEAVAAKGGKYVDLSPYFRGADGRYSERGPDETGADRKLRARDGITFMKQGNSRFGQLLLATIKTAEAEMAGQPGAAAANGVIAAPGSGVTITVEAALPQFGQQGLDGEEIAFNAAEMKASGVGGRGASAALGADGQASSAPVIHAAIGSAAELLFTTGAGVVPPAGRFDDYSIPAGK